MCEPLDDNRCRIIAAGCWVLGARDSRGRPGRSDILHCEVGDVCRPHGGCSAMAGHAKPSTGRVADTDVAHPDEALDVLVWVPT